jgi:hypothetical protein
MVNYRILCIGVNVGTCEVGRSVLIVSCDHCDVAMTVDAEERLDQGSLDMVVFSTHISRKEKERLRMKMPCDALILNLDTLDLPSGLVDMLEASLSQTVSSYAIN